MTLKLLLKTIMNLYPRRLLIRERLKLPTSEFIDSDQLFRSFKKEELDTEDKIQLETISFPDISCNWDRFSKPKDVVLYRRNANKKDGSYSFSVKTARFKFIATPVHDPINCNEYPNYSHVEIRVLKESDAVNIDPPPKRKLNSKIKKHEYRLNIATTLKIEREAK